MPSRVPNPDLPPEPGDDFTYADRLPQGSQRGRGAQLNPGNRYETTRLHVLGEHLDALQNEKENAAASRDHNRFDERADESTAMQIEDEQGRQVLTHVYADKTRTLINRVDSPDIGFNWTINPYRGCAHGCIYCYARPFHEQLGFSCGLDFETKIVAKFDAPAMLRKELDKPSWKGECIGMSGVTDCYQPLEKKLRITRGCLEVMTACRQPVSLVTKSSLILRDLDLLAELAKFNAVYVAISLTSLDNKMASKLEPRACSPARRIEAIRQLSEAGVPVTAMVAPIVPGLTDEQVPRILQAAADAGAVSAGYTIMRLPYQVKALFLDWVAREYLEKSTRMESLIRSVRDGKLNDSTFGTRMKGQGEMASQIGQMFKVFKKRAGLPRRQVKVTSEHFMPPRELVQGRLF